MKRLTYGILWSICLIVSTTFGRTIYVDVDSTNSVLPYANWKTAVANIPEALGLAVDGDVVLVADGTYAVSEQLTLDKGITLSSVDGPDATRLRREASMSKPPFHRVVYMTASNAVLDGFSISGGMLLVPEALNGAGLYIAANGGVVKNCIVEGNVAGVGDGGGIYCEQGGIVESSIIRGNSAHRAGGIMCDGCTVLNCVIQGNQCNRGGAGIVCVGNGEIMGCCIAGNSGESSGGVWLDTGVMQNSLVVSNTAELWQGGGVIFRSGLIQNCTIVKNTARGSGGGVSGCDVMRNTIVMFNSCGGGGPGENLASRATDAEVSHCCIDPAPDGVGNFSKNPLFVDLENGDFHLQKDSPCIDAGNRTGAPDTDLDRNARPADGNGDGTAEFDIGAYEFRN